MSIYLPIAEVSLDVFLLIGIGGLIGFLSGLFGVGGGFLLTPLLMFIGIPAPVAVGSAANQLVASSVAGVMAHWRRGTVDFKMGGVLLAGGVGGSALGVWLFAVLREMGQIDLAISLCYVVFLGIIGLLMLVESIRTFMRQRGSPRRRKLHHHTWLHGLPFKMRFTRSRLYISALLPLGVGFFVGILAAVMGVGGGFVMVPAMIYLLGMPAQVVVGTSLFQILFVAGSVTLLQSTQNHSVDVVLALFLLLGSVVAVQFGTYVGTKLRGEQFRILLAILVLGVCMKLLVDLAARPNDLYGLQMPMGG